VSCIVSPEATGSVVNSAEVSSSIVDPDPGNNHSMDVTSLNDDIIFKDNFQ